MTLQNDQDPGWWRRGMTPRGIRIVVAVCVAVIVIGIVIAAVNGVAFF
ncbi:hypothetical protein BH09ACT5_BH09ACT5_23020 [soil metagenome]